MDAAVEKVSDQFSKDVIVTARCGAIGYWAQETGYYASIGAMMIDECDEETGERTDSHVITAASIREAIRMILLGDVAVHRDIAMSIWQGNRDKDAGMIDADAADVIVQVACFGQIVYG